jgi:hypothetical protein
MTWLFIPSTTSTCAQAPECSDSHLKLPLVAIYEPFLTLNGKPTRRPLWWHGWRKRPWIALLSGMILRPPQTRTFLDTFADSILSSFPADIPANPSPAPENALEQTIIATYGPGLINSLARFSRMFASSRTSPDMFPSDMPKSNETSKTEATEFRRVYSARRKWAQAIAGNGSTSLPCAIRWDTPRAASADKHGPHQTDAAGRPQLTAQAVQWPTPRSSESENRTTHHAPSHGNSHGKTLAGSATTWPTPMATERENVESWEKRRNLGNVAPPPLALAAVNWPTPQARDHFPSHTPEYVAEKKAQGHGMSNLNDFVSLYFAPLPETSNNGNPSSVKCPISPRRLNPNFVEHLMGWPIAWTRTDSALSETEWSRWLRLMRSSLSMLLSRFDLEENSKRISS